MKLKSCLSDYIDNISNIDGFSNEAQLALIDVMLSSFENPINALEIGSWHGRTTVQLAQYSRSVSFVEIDTERREIVKNNIKQYSNLTDADIHEYSDSFKLFPTTFPEFFDFVHIDGLHTKAAVSHDLNLTTQILNDGGLICLDDFFSEEYPQITEATYEFLFTHRNYCLVFAGYNKGLICKTSDYAKYHYFFTNIFPVVFKQLLFPNCTISKTSTVADSFTFGVVGCDDEKFTHRGLDENPQGCIEHIAYEYNVSYMDENASHVLKEF